MYFQNNGSKIKKKKSKRKTITGKLLVLGGHLKWNNKNEIGIRLSIFATRISPEWVGIFLFGLGLRRREEVSSSEFVYPWIFLFIVPKKEKKITKELGGRVGDCDFHPSLQPCSHFA